MANDKTDVLHGSLALMVLRIIGRFLILKPGEAS